MGSKLLLISIYAPNKLLEKRLMWYYLSKVINRWDGDIMVMGIFNEVHVPKERIRYVFHAWGALAFNNFIATTCLVDILLGSYSFTSPDRHFGKMKNLKFFIYKVMDICAHSHNKSGNVTINSNILLGYTQEQNEADLKRYLFERLVLLTT